MYSTNEVPEFNVFFGSIFNISMDFFNQWRNMNYASELPALWMASYAKSVQRSSPLPR